MASTAEGEGEGVDGLEQRSKDLLAHCGRVIKLRRQGLKLTQEQVGTRIGLSGQTISEFERGYSWPLMKHIVAIVEVLELPWALLLSEPPTSPSAQLLTAWALCDEHAQASILTIVQQLASRSQGVYQPPTLEAASA